MRDIAEIQGFISCYQKRCENKPLTSKESALFNKIVKEELATSGSPVQTRAVTPRGEETGAVELFLKQYPSQEALIKHFLELDTWAKEEETRQKERGENPFYVNSAVNQIIKYYEYGDHSFLDLSQCNLRSLPKCIAKFSKLEQIILSYNKLEELPEFLSRLSNLSSIVCRSNNFEKLPDILKNITNLDSIIFSGNPLKEIPKWVGELKKLTHLQLDKIPLKEFPEFLRGFTQLQSLSLNGCELESVPAWIGELKDLIYLYLGNNRLTYLPQSIGNLEHLENLDLQNNAVETLPDSMAQLTQLKDLLLRKNRIEVLPEWIGRLEKLSKLDVGENRVKDLPESITKQKSLSSLSISGNALHTLPVSIRSLLTQLNFLSHHSNPFTIGINQLGEEIVPLWEKFPLDETSPEFEKYIVRKQDFAKSYGYDTDQRRYGNLMHQAVQMGGVLISQKRKFSDLLRFFSDRRCAMALLTGDKAALTFGLEKTSSITTTCSSPPYDAIPLKLQELHLREAFQSPSYKIQKDQGVEELKKEVGDAILASDSRLNYEIGTYVGRIEGEEVPLNRLVMATKIVKGEKTYRNQIIVHTNPKNIPIILKHVEKLYKEALELEGEELTEKLGEIFWWICQAKPWERGDPSIAEMLIKSVFHFKGYQVPAWKKGVIPWAEVMCFPDLKEFLKHFPTLFDGKVQQGER